MKAAHYDTYNYNAYWDERNYEHFSEEIALKRILSKIKKTDRIAEVGCGFGRLTSIYAPMARETLLIEPSKKLLEEAKHQNGKFKNIKYIQGGIEDLLTKVEKESLDVVLLVRVMHHLKDPLEALSILSSRVKPGGHIILEFANKIHGKALVKNFFKGNFTYPMDLSPIDRRCNDNQKSSVIPFYNYHPDTISQAAKKLKLKTRLTLSVSNVRSEFLKKKLPFGVLLEMEKRLQMPMARIYFGPSIFLLLEKKS